MRSFFKFLFSRIFLCILLIAAQVAAIIFLCFLLPTVLSLTAWLLFSYLFTAAVALSLMNRNAPAEFKCAWLAFIAALPVAGGIIYLIAIYRPKRLERTLRFEGCALPPPFGCDKAEYFEDGGQYFKRLFEEIDKAKEFIYLEYYIIAKGRVLDELTARLKAAAGRGVEIKIIVDGLVSSLRLKSKHLKELKKLGEIKIFHKILPLPLSRINFRDHRKIAAIDGKVAFTGGVNVADEYVNLTSPHGYWKDTGVALYGEIAQAFSQLFLSVFEGGGRVAQPPEGEGKWQVTPLYDSPPCGRGLCEDTLASLINSAEKEILIFTPYLCAGEKLKSALSFAAGRGVDVKIIMPHVPDKKFIFEISRTFAAELTACGVEVYEFTPGFMHAKGVVCDQKTIIGSYNLDFRSMNLNYECAALLPEGCLTDDVRRDFYNCLSLSAPFKAVKISPFRRAYRCVLKLFAPLF